MTDERLDRLDAPLTDAELTLYREGLRDAPTLNFIGPASLLEISTAEWADRCRRLLATLDAAVRERDKLRDIGREIVRFYGTDRTWSLAYRAMLGSRIDELDAALHREDGA